MARHCGAADETGSRVNAIPTGTGRGRDYRPLCSGAVPTISTRTTLCHLTPAPETTRRGESSPGHHSLGNLLQGLGNLGIHVCRASHDGSASAPTESRLLTQSTHSDRHVDRHAPLQDNTGAPRRIGSDVTGALPQYFKDRTTLSTTPP